MKFGKDIELKVNISSLDDFKQNTLEQISDVYTKLKEKSNLKDVCELLDSKSSIPYLQQSRTLTQHLRRFTRTSKSALLKRDFRK